MNEKQKIEGVDNKELKAFVAIIAVLIILLLFEMFFYKGRPEVAEEAAKTEEMLQEMQNTTVEAEEKTVYKALNNIVDMMNRKEYQSLYEMLKDDYKNYYFRDFESFKKFVEIYAGQEYSPKYGSYYRDENMYYIMVEFLKSKYTREDLLNEMPVKVDTIVLEEQEDKSFKFAMNGFVENIIHNSSKTVDGITFTLQNSVRNTETMKTSVIVTNNSEKSLSLSTSNVNPDILGSTTAKLSVTSSIHLEPGESEIISIEYYFQYNSNKELKGIRITGLSFADGTKIEDVYLPN
ncbi:MAG: hypothetical protein E7314_01165 [Clostridiales bacterium]|nr:hypothetical protein [Clostridiales bacterium]